MTGFLAVGSQVALDEAIWMGKVRWHLVSPRPRRADSVCGLVLCFSGWLSRLARPEVRSRFYPLEGVTAGLAHARLRYAILSVRDRDG